MSDTRGISSSHVLSLIVLMCTARELETAIVNTVEAATWFDGVGETTVTNSELCYVCDGSYSNSSCGYYFEQNDPSVSLLNCTGFCLTTTTGTY